MKRAIPASGRRLLYTGLLLSGLSTQVHADCAADSGDVDNIVDSGVTVSCDTADPNPFTTGIGSVATAADLTVTVADGSAVTVDGVAVTLGSNGEVTNNGEISGSGEAVLSLTTLGTERSTITNTALLTSTAGTALDTAASNAIISNTGTISGVTGGVVMTGSSLDNGGTVSASSATATAIDAGSDSAVTNTGSITSEGDGVLLGAGSTLDNDGTISATGRGVLLGQDASLDNSATVAASDGSAATLEAGAAVTNSGTLSSSSAVAVVLNGPATLTSTGTVSSDAAAAITATGATIDIGGTVSAGTTEAISLTGDSNSLTLRDGADVQGDITVSGGAMGNSWQLLGAGSYGGNAAGFNTLTLQGDRWSLGGTIGVDTLLIESGTLALNGTLTSLNDVSLSTGTLAGTGTLLADLLNNGGTVAAGDPTGTLTIQGNYTQTSSGTLRAQASGSGIGVLQVTGSADLAGNLIVEAGADTVADILIADGGINGFFDDVTVEGRALATVVALDNSIRVVRVSPTLEDNMVEANLDNSYLALDMLRAPRDPQAPSGLWVEGLGHYGERDDVDGLPGGDYLIGGAAVGGDWRVSDNFRLGAAVGYTSLDLDSDDGSDGEADNVNYGVYARYDNGFLHGALTLAGVSGDYDQDRRVVVNGATNSVAASYDSTSWAVRASFGTRHDFLGDLEGSWLFEPTINVDYVVADLDSYADGSAAGLQYSIDDIESLQLAGLLKVRQVREAQTALAPYFHAGVVHRIAIDDREWNARSPGTDLVLLLEGNDDDLTSGAVGAGIEFRLRGSLEGFAEWRGEFADDKQRHIVLAGLRIAL